MFCFARTQAQINQIMKQLQSGWNFFRTNHASSLTYKGTIYIIHVDCTFDLIGASPK